MLEHKGEQLLIERFALDSFSVNVLCVERTLVEKILGLIKDSYAEDPIDRLSNRIRHMYDICLILKDEQYRAFLSSAEFKVMCEACIEDERATFLSSSACFWTPLRRAPLFTEIEEWAVALQNTYVSVFAQLVYGNLPPMVAIVNTIQFVYQELSKQDI